MNSSTSLYSQRGVSAQKEDVHTAIENLEQGLFPYAFCKMYPDYLGNDDNFINISHADGAGTKSILAYLYFKQTGDISVFEGIAQDAIVMNLDDLLCVGIFDNILFSSTIDRNKSLIDGKILQAIINGNQSFFQKLKNYNVNINYVGGETADVGDIVRTIAVNGTMTARWAKNKIVSNELIDEGQVIVGFASSGQATYETEYNSGIGSNGLTSARHDVLNKSYATNFPESFEPTLKNEVVYIGNQLLTNEVEVNGTKTNIGKLLLSPTRTYAPLMVEILQNHFSEVYGIIHCSGGGQTKCMKYLPKPLHIVKDNLFEIPPIFKIIQENSGASFKEMYEVFNMGHRLEIFTNQTAANKMIAIANTLNIEAKIIGRVEAPINNQKKLTVKGSFGEINY
ncbi:MAG: AIR synthase related protein [Chitinophagaceae bacterium]